MSEGLAGRRRTQPAVPAAVPRGASPEAEASGTLNWARSAGPATRSEPDLTPPRVRRAPAPEPGVVQPELSVPRETEAREVPTGVGTSDCWTVFSASVECAP